MSKSPTKQTKETNADESGKPEQPPKLEEIRLVKKEFTFKLTNDEIAMKATRIADLSTMRLDAERTLDQAKGAFKAEDSRLESAIAHELNCIRTKSEMRDVEVEQVHDFVRKVVYWRFGQDILGERAMEQRERQANLPLVEKAEAKDETPPADTPQNDQEAAQV